MAVNLKTNPPLLPSDVARVLGDGRPTSQLLDFESYQANWFTSTVVDLQTQVTTVSSATNDNAASITTETTARTSADAALAGQITTLTATVGSNAASISAESTARANGDSALAGQITTLSTTVGANTSSLTTLSASINGVAAQYGVFGTINGVTGGFVLQGVRKLDGSVSFGFEFTASSFVLSDPNLPGGSGNVFSYSTALGAFVFNVPVKIGKSELAPQSVVIPGRAVWSGGSGFAVSSTLTFVTGMSVTFVTTRDAYVRLSLQGLYGVQGPAGGFGYIGLELDGTQVVNTITTASGQAPTPIYSAVCSYEEILAAGSHTVRVTCGGAATPGGATVYVTPIAGMKLLTVAFDN